MTSMNNYIFEYYQKIKDGSIIVGKWILLWYELIVYGLQESKFFYDAKKANRAINYVERYCRHHEGILAPQLIKLELWQKALTAVIFGIVDSTGNRQFREVLLVISRKNGKTLFASAIASYCAFADNEYGGRIYMTAPKLQQASICFDGFFQMVQKEPKLNALSKKRRTDVYIESTNTSVMPLAFSVKKSDGLNISLGICDEVASWEGEQGLKFYEVLKSSMGARKQPLLLSCTTSGYINNGIYDELIKRATAVIQGTSAESRFAPFLYMIDDPEKWNDINELAKSNPNLGVSVSVDYLLEEIAVAEGSFSKKGEFLTKYCNIKQNSSIAWLPATVVDAVTDEELTLDDFRDSYAVGGIDLSQTTDLTACCVIIEKNKKLYAFVQFYMPTNKLEELTLRDGIPYKIFVEQGILKLSGENFVDYNDCFEWFKMLVEEYEILPLQIGYDRYSSQYLIQQLTAYGFHCDDVWQGENLTPVIKEAEGLIRDKTLQFGKNQLMKAHLLNTALKQNQETRKVRIVKVNVKQHIDGTACVLDALTVRQKHFDTIGWQLSNEREDE